MKTPPTAAAGSIRRASIAIAIVISAMGCEKGVAPEDASTEPDPSLRAARVEPTLPTAFSGVVATELPVAPSVRVTDRAGTPVPGVAVSFKVAYFSGTVGQTFVLTDARGLATAISWKLGTAAGPQTVTAQVPGLNWITFTATARADAPASITGLVTDDRIACAGAELPGLRVRVADVHANPVSGAEVAFSVPHGGGSVERTSAITNGDGIAESGPWTLGATHGVQTSRAQSGVASAEFTAYAFAPLADAGRLVFVSRRDGDDEIYSANPDGSDVRRLTTHPDIDFDPAWSPDGCRIAFASGRDFQSIHVMSSDGIRVARRVTGAPSSGPTWSPSGTIAFSMWRSGVDEIATVSSAGTLTTLTQKSGPGSQPAWSIDGSQLALVSNWGDSYDDELYIYTANADGTGRTLRAPRVVAGSRVRDFIHPAWSPDGKMIAFVYGTLINLSPNGLFFTAARFNVAVMTAGGVFIKDLAWAGDLEATESHDPGSLAWSPDGRGIAYTFVDCDLVTTGGCPKGWPEKYFTRSIRYVSLDGSDDRTILTNAWSPSWRR